MKLTKSIAAAMIATAALWIAGPASAAGKGGHAGGGHAAASVRGAGLATRASRTSQNAWTRPNRRFYSIQSFPYYGGYGYGGAVYQNPDEADWAEQWSSLYNDNDGPYARSTRENPLGGARMWVIDENDGNQTKP